MLAKMAAADEFDFVIHNGDISYADHQIGKKTDRSYNDWMNIYYANISVRFFVSSGWGVHGTRAGIIVGGGTVSATVEGLVC